MVRERGGNGPGAGAGHGVCRWRTGCCWWPSTTTPASAAPAAVGISLTTVRQVIQRLEPLLALSWPRSRTPRVLSGCGSWTAPSCRSATARSALHTSHRARGTIATQLLNARDPLTLGDLQQWLGHKHPASTRYYAKILQRTLTAAYKKADYFARNVRTIEVLIDRDSVLTGAAAAGEQPWKYYDLGDGYCSYDFFAKCPHRMACARCPFYVPKESTKCQLLAVKDGINKVLAKSTSPKTNAKHSKATEKRSPLSPSVSQMSLPGRANPSRARNHRCLHPPHPAPGHHHA